MEMGAVRDDYALEERVVKAVNAGTDLLVFSNVTRATPSSASNCTPSSPMRCATGASHGLASKAYGKIGAQAPPDAHDLAGKW